MIFYTTLVNLLMAFHHNDLRLFCHLLFLSTRSAHAITVIKLNLFKSYRLNSNLINALIL